MSQSSHTLNSHHPATADAQFKHLSSALLTSVVPGDLSVSAVNLIQSFTRPGHTTFLLHMSAVVNQNFPLYRESIYQLLSQTTPENTSKNYVDYSLDPRTRYRRVDPSSIQTSQVRSVLLRGSDSVNLNSCTSALTLFCSGAAPVRH